MAGRSNAPVLRSLSTGDLTHTMVPPRRGRKIRISVRS